MNRRALLLGSATVLAGAGAARLLSNPIAHAAERFAITRTDEEWRRVLTPSQYSVLRKHGTENAGSSPLDRERRAGTFACAGCDFPVFRSSDKFDSGTGWPSFTRPIEGAVGTSEDRSLAGARTEVHCHRCGGHLGHVFNDGPKPTGLRYCINGVAMKFTPSRTS